MKNPKITLSLIAMICLSNSIYAKEVTSLDKMTVTAQKTDENALKVPISLTVFDEFSLADKNIDTVSDMGATLKTLKNANQATI